MDNLSSKVTTIIIMFSIFTLFVIGFWLFGGLVVSTTSVRAIDDTRTILADVANTAVSKAAKTRTTYTDPVEIAESEIINQLRTITVPARSEIDKINSSKERVALRFKVKSYRCWTEVSPLKGLSDGNRGSKIVCEIIPTNITHKAFLSVPEEQKPYVDKYKEYDVTQGGRKGAPITARATIAYQYKE